MQTKWTPGPWTQEREFNERGTVDIATGHTSVEIHANGTPIGIWIDYENSGHSANSRLIAAAPAMYEALAECENWLSEYESGPDGGLHGLLGLARAALAAAPDMGRDGDVPEMLRDMALALYRRLCEAYEVSQSDEYVDDGIRSNEYTFTADGQRFG